MNKKIVFVILHYITLKDTINAINSIKKYCKNYEIVIVDNASPNKSALELEEKYKNDSLVHFIMLKKNLGFAKGMNMGFKFAKEKLNPTFIILMNNDTEILNEKFCFQLEKEYKRSSFAVLGPKIKLSDGIYFYQNPNLISKNKLLFKIFLNYIVLIFTYLYLYVPILFIVDFIKRVKKDKPLYNREENILINGCFLIFSKKYLEKFDGLDEKTFLYREEEFLYLQLKRENLLSVYNPDIEIMHKQDMATNALNKNKRKRIIFKYSNLIKANRTLLRNL